MSAPVRIWVTPGRRRTLPDGRVLLPDGRIQLASGAIHDGSDGVLVPDDVWLFRNLRWGDVTTERPAEAAPAEPASTEAVPTEAEREAEGAAP